MIDTILGFEFNNTLGILLYWVPFLFCIIGYTWRTWQNYKKDIVRRRDAEQHPDKPPFYFPTDTLGDLLCRALLAAVPIANLWAAMFDLVPSIFGRIFLWLGKTFSQPLVPVRRKAK